MRGLLSGCAAACLLVSVFASCEDDSPVPPTPPGVVKETHIIRDVDYVTNKYFLIDLPSHPVGAKQTGFDVFLTVTPAELIADPTIMSFPGWAIPDTLSDGQEIWDAAAEIIAGRTPFPGLFQDFRLLDPGTDYSLIFDDSIVVGLELATAVPPTAQKALAVRYVNQNSVAIGGTYASYGINASPDTLLLEMIKWPDPRPTGPPASIWGLAMRNVYDLGWHDIDGNSLRVAIEDVLNPRIDPGTPEGSTVPYLLIFGLDQTDNLLGAGPPDGLIDLARIDLTRGILWFPDPRALAPDPANVTNWTAGLFEFMGSYQSQYDTSKRIYDELLNPITENDVHQYLIRVAATVPAS